MAMKSKAYAYLRVSTFTQVDGKSLEGQLEEIAAMYVDTIIIINMEAVVEIVFVQSSWRVQY